MKRITSESLKVMKLIGDKLVKIRKDKGLTQQDLSLILDITRVSVSNIEAGRHMITLDNAIKICNYFNVTYMDIFPDPATYVMNFESLNKAMKKKQEIAEAKSEFLKRVEQINKK